VALIRPETGLRAISKKGDKYLTNVFLRLLKIQQDFAVERATNLSSVALRFLAIPSAN
jgi:hypothetical protein